MRNSFKGGRFNSSMFEGFIAWVVANKVPLIFYLTVILIVVLNRKKLEWQGIAGMYKTKVGVSLMQKLADKHGPLFRWLGYVGMGVGFTGMFAIVWMLVWGFWQLLTDPSAPAVVAPVIPGFNIPGVGIEVPLVIGWLALFVVIVVHEFSHGVVSKAHKIPIESSGLLVFGPILGAFVEPNEKKLKKASDVVQYSIFAAGPFSNILAAGVTLIVGFFVSLAIGLVAAPGGVILDTVTVESPAAMAGLEADMVLVEAKGIPINTQEDLIAALSTVREGEQINLQTDKGEYLVTARPDADERTDKGILGISFRQDLEANEGYGWLFTLLLLVQEFITWLFILNLGIGLANLLPLGPVDGGQMLRTFFVSLWGKEKGEKHWMQVSKIVLILLIVLLFVPIIKAFF